MEIENLDKNTDKKAPATTAAEARQERIRKMRGGWQHINPSGIVHSHADVGGDVDYGSGHSGWNR